MLGFLRAIEVLQKQKNQVVKQMRKSSAEEKKSLQTVLDELEEAISYMHLKVNDYLVYMQNTDRKTAKVIRRHFFEGRSWGYSVDDIDMDEEAYRKSISRACKKYDLMSKTDKESYIK